MRGTDAGGSDDPGPRQHAVGKEHQQEADEERGVRDRANENERGNLRNTNDYGSQPAAGVTQEKAPCGQRQAATDVAAWLLHLYSAQ